MKKTDGAKLTSKTPSLKSLPPTDEALDLNILRAHLQAAYWHHSVSGELPMLDKFMFGFEEDPENPSMLRPVMMPTGCPIAPEDVLRVTRCNCSCKAYLNI